MNRIFLTVFMLFLWTSTTFANPTCILMKFTDDTRYDSIESAEALSDMLMEKLFETGKFNFKETKPIDSDIEITLYDEKMRDLKKLIDAEKSGDYSPLFESDGFDEKKAQSIATAQVGQIISPKITSQIGKDHNAEYLIQGTIINLGTGDWINEDFSKLSSAINTATTIITSTAAPALASTLGPLGNILQMMELKTLGIGVQADVRIIKAETGEVIWNKRFVGYGEQKAVEMGFISFGPAKLSNKLYVQGMEKVTKKIVDAMLEDMKNGTLFVK